jgi:hypothetical protein
MKVQQSLYIGPSNNANNVIIDFLLCMHFALPTPPPPPPGGGGGGGSNAQVLYFLAFTIQYLKVYGDKIEIIIWAPT